MTDTQGIPIVDYKHECDQSRKLVGVIEDQRDEIERLNKALWFHKRETEEAEARLKAHMAVDTPTPSVTVVGHQADA